MYLISLLSLAPSITGIPGGQGAQGLQSPIIRNQFSDKRTEAKIEGDDDKISALDEQLNDVLEEICEQCAINNRDIVYHYLGKMTLPWRETFKQEYGI